MLPHFAHAIVRATELGFLSCIESGDVWEIARAVVRVAQDISAALVNLTCEAIENPAMGRYPGSHRLKVMLCSLFQACQSLSEATEGAGDRQ